VYNDPAERVFDPPLVFDAQDPAQRVLHYCSLYNNGVASDGSPDPETVTRASRVPPQGFICNPVACTAGKIGASCFGDHRRCDSSRGAGAGGCDAGATAGGESTESEMFILIGSSYRPPAGGVPAGLAGPPARSLLTEP